ncbi:hypothetical protein HAX54_031409 [Datura stramonium]|uniref:Uncharacterized protein n=1 Tax=Datura stramonium TaxID=4076 RepID=A0ABS8VCR7_DATST|nr:hypothetical protein [Datura stramonium]
MAVFSSVHSLSFSISNLGFVRRGFRLLLTPPTPWSNQTPRSDMVSGILQEHLRHEITLLHQPHSTFLSKQLTITYKIENPNSSDLGVFNNGYREANHALFLNVDKEDFQKHIGQERFPNGLPIDGQLAFHWFHCGADADFEC